MQQIRRYVLPVILIILTVAVSAPFLTSANTTPGPSTESDRRQGACVQEQDGIVIIEVEDANLAGTQWTFGNPNPQTNLNSYPNASLAQYPNAIGSWQERNNLTIRPRSGGWTGTGYIRWGTNEFFSSIPRPLLTYEICINTPGIYRLEMHSLVESGAGDDGNDAWFHVPDVPEANMFAADSNPFQDPRVVGNRVYPRGNSAGLTPIVAGGSNSEGFFKLFNNATQYWNWQATTYDNNSHYVYVDFDSAGQYTIEFSGRSRLFIVNRLVLWNIDTTNRGRAIALPAVDIELPGNNLLRTTEDGLETDFFLVRLTTQPTADVFIDITVDDPTEQVVSPTTLTFTPSNWNVQQTVTVTGVFDGISDGSQDTVITVGPARSTDSLYDGFPSTDLRGRNLNRNNPPPDTAGITVNPTSGLTTTESGSTDTFTVVLDSVPTSDVTINLSSGDTGEVTVNPTQLTFTAGNALTPQTVTLTGVDDDIADGNQTVTITLSPATSGDGDYSGLDPDDVNVTNEDEDVLGITVSPTNTVTSETGTTDTFTVVLGTAPTSNVTINLSSGDTGEVTVNPAALTFTDANFDTPQTVTLTGVNDDVDDGNQTVTIAVTATSVDTDYNAIDPDDVTVTNQDDDTAGITVTAGESPQETGEDGDTFTFTIVLDTEPTGNVDIGFVSSDVTEGTVNGPFTFTATNWDIPQTVTVTGQDDVVIDDNIIYSVTGTTTSGDGSYDGLNVDPGNITNLDNEAGIFITPTTGLTTTEAGGTATFEVRFSGNPTSNITVNFTSPDTGEVTVTASLTFTPANFRNAQTVTVTGVNDDVDDGNQMVNIGLATVSTDSNFNGMSVPTVQVTNQDDDTAGITVTANETPAETSEDGDTATFDVVLDSEPTVSVTVTLVSSDTSEGTVPPSLTFTPGNWDNPQTFTVTGQDDGLVDGNIAYLVTATGGGAEYGGLFVNTPTITNLDNEDGIIVTPTTLTTTEAGGTATFTVQLTGNPTADVIIDLVSSDTGEVTVNPAQLTFTTANFATVQTVTVTGVDDAIDDGDQAVTIVTGSTSGDADFDTIDPADVAVTNTDDDTLGVNLSTTALTISEASGTGTFTVVLGSEPTATVTIDLSSSDTSEAIINPTQLTFTAANFATPQTVTVTGVDDFDADGSQTATISLTASGGDYAGAPISDVIVTVTDDDSLEVIVSRTTLSVNESGTTDSFNVSLGSLPSGDVTVTLNNSDTGEASLSTGTLTFTPGNFNTPQVVTVTGVDDALDDGDQTVTVSLNATGGGYDSVIIPSVTVTVVDNDGSGVTLSSTTATVSETGTTDTFTVVLDSQPTGDVTITLSSSDIEEATVSPAQLTFTTANWNVPQTVTITGVDDLLDDNNQTVTITLAASGGGYGSVIIPTVTVTVTDDEVTIVGDVLTVQPGTLNIGEDDPNATPFIIVMTQPPAAGETITVTFSYDGGQMTLSQNTVTFTAANYNQPVTIFVNAINDGIEEPITPYDITATTSSSLGGTPFDGLQTSVRATLFDSVDAIIVFVPNIGELTLRTGTATGVYENAGGNPLRNPSDFSQIFLPFDADGNGFDTYVITDYSQAGDGTLWLGLWLGSGNWGWVIYDAAIMEMTGEIWDLIN